jgi:hypothetical protein
MSFVISIWFSNINLSSYWGADEKLIIFCISLYSQRLITTPTYIKQHIDSTYEIRKINIRVSGYSENRDSSSLK